MEELRVKTNTAAAARYNNRRIQLQYPPWMPKQP